jgi:Tfp pilus assembly protein PilW
MTPRRKLTLTAATVLTAVALAGAAYVQASGDEGETSATGPQVEHAKAAALKITKGGEANAVERDNENGATWEVEVTKTDGATVDVRLDEHYGLVIVEGDHEDATGK